MDQVVDHDVWQIDPVTATVKPAAGMREPVVVVVEPQPSLALAIAELCGFLHIRIEQVAAARDLPPLLTGVRPIAVLSEADRVDVNVYDLLMAVAGYDTALPVLMVIAESPTTTGALEAAQKLWQLTGVVRSGQRPGIRAMVDFLFMAGRKSGTGRMVPL